MSVKSIPAVNTTETTIAGAVKSLLFDFERFESDREAVAALRKLAESVQVVDAFISAIPTESRDVPVSALADALSKLVNRSKRDDLRTIATTAARYVY